MQSEESYLEIDNYFQSTICNCCFLSRNWKLKTVHWKLNIRELFNFIMKMSVYILHWISNSESFTFPTSSLLCEKLQLSTFNLTLRNNHIENWKLNIWSFSKCHSWSFKLQASLNFQFAIFNLSPFLFHPYCVRSFNFQLSISIFSFLCWLLYRNWTLTLDSWTLKTWAIPKQHSSLFNLHASFIF